MACFVHNQNEYLFTVTKEERNKIILKLTNQYIEDNTIQLLSMDVATVFAKYWLQAIQRFSCGCPSWFPDLLNLNMVSSGVTTLPALTTIVNGMQQDECSVAISKNKLVC